MKRHLRIKRFFGCFENVVKVQISIYVLIMRKKLGIDTNLCTILQILFGDALRENLIKTIACLGDKQI